MEKAGTVSKQNTKIRFFREADGIPPNPCRKNEKKIQFWVEFGQNMTLPSKIGEGVSLSFCLGIV